LNLLDAQAGVWCLYNSERRMDSRFCDGVYGGQGWGQDRRVWGIQIGIGVFGVDNSAMLLGVDFPLMLQHLVVVRSIPGRVHLPCSVGDVLQLMEKMGLEKCEICCLVHGFPRYCVTCLPNTQASSPLSLALVRRVERTGCLRPCCLNLTNNGFACQTMRGGTRFTCS